MMSSLKLTGKADNKLSSEETSQFQTPSSPFHNYTKSYGSAMEISAVEKVKQVLASLKLEGINRAEAFMELKHAVSRVTDLEQFLYGGELMLI